MNKSLKYTIIIAAVLTLSVAMGLLIFAVSFNIKEYKQEIITVVEQRTGRDFSIQGDISLAPSLIPTVVIEEATLGNPDWAQRQSMLSIGRLEAQIALLPLLKQQIVIHRIALSQPVVHLEIGPDGRGNWLLGNKLQSEQTPDADSALGQPSLDIRELQIDTAQITYHGYGKTEPITFNINLLTAEPQAFGESLKLNLQASHEGLPIQLQGSIGSMTQMLASGPYPLSLEAEIGSAVAQIEGRIEQPQQLAGIQAELDFEAGSLADFNEAADLDWPAIGPLTVRGDLSGGPDQFVIKPFSVRLAKSDLAGEIQLVLSEERPAINARLESEQLNFIPFQDDDKQEDSKIFSSEKFDLSILNLVNAEARIQAARILARQAELANLDLRLTLRDGVLNLQPEARIADGDLEGHITVEVKSEAPRFDININVDNMLPAQLPALRQDPPIRDGRTDIRFDGRGSGNSEAEIAAGLDGTLLVKTGRGQLLNNMTDLAGSDLIFTTFQFINPLSDSDNQSELICGVMNFDIKEGIARADEGIALQTSKVNVLGSGIIDLGSEAIAIRAKPRARKGLGISLSQLGEGVYIGGTLSDPRPTTDLEGVLKTAGAVGAAFATGGLSLLAQGLFDRTFAAEDPCAAALDKRSPSAQQGGTQHDTPNRSGTAQQPERKNVLERAADKLDKVLTDIFGD